MRFAALLVATALLFAGCLGAASVPSADSPTGDAPERTESPTTGSPDEPTATPECEETAVSTVDPDRESVTPSELPDRPEEFTADSVEAYVTAYERAYARNVGLESDTEQYEVSVYDDSTVREIDGGYAVNLTAVYWYNAGGPSEGTETATIVHADGPRYEVVYTVKSDRMRRDSALDDDRAAVGVGPIVECWS